MTENTKLKKKMSRPYLETAKEIQALSILLEQLSHDGEGELAPSENYDEFVHQRDLMLGQAFRYIAQTDLLTNNDLFDVIHSRLKNLVIVSKNISDTEE